MIKVVFAGDEPSNTNASEHVAFVGAACFKRLVSWIKYLGPDFYVCSNTHTGRELQNIIALQESGFKVLALGKNASEKLSFVNVPHKMIAHPSGLNRKLNNKQYELDQLRVALEYIRGKK